jgi:putative transcription factor
LRCEVCGCKIHSDPLRTIIEGAKLTVCVECSKHGKIITQQEEDLAPKTSITQNKPHAPVSMMQRKRQLVAKVELTQEIIEGYDSKIRVAREKLGLTVEDLGLKISEKASVLRHIENAKMPPNNQLASKLERTLKIKLLVPISKEETEIPKAANRELTLGDLIDFKDNSGEEPKERKQS